MKRLSWLVAVGLGAALLALPAPAQDKETINQALERGVRYLKSQQLENGTWAHTYNGATSLCALTLLECGVPADDPAVQKAAKAVRKDMVGGTHVYSISLAILFLDRLGEPGDVALIEALTTRLLEAQTAYGGWNYATPPVGEAEVRRLTTATASGAGTERRKPGETEKREVKDLAPEIQDQLKRLPARRAAFAAQEIRAGDNSNTQFAILALWVARRHGLPVDQALLETEARFRRSQNRADGGWGYMVSMGEGFGPGMGPLVGGDGPNPQGAKPDGLVAGSLPLGNRGIGSNGPMTCAGLLGLGLAYGAWNETTLRTDPKAGGSTRPGPAGGGGAPKDPDKDVNVKLGLRALGACVGNPGGEVPTIGNNSRVGRAYYFLWSLERVAVAFDLDTIGNKDWYGWGCEILLANQDGSGGWTNGEYSEGCCDSAFAMLFLKRVNLLGDLTRSLKGKIKDPGKRILAAGDVGGAALKKDAASAATAKAAKAMPPLPQPETPAGRLVSQLLDGSGARQDDALAKLRDGKGAAYTDALAAAIHRLNGPIKKKAREALAERLSGLKAITLGDKMEDEDLEVRRAAALACAMKEDTTNVGKMIDLLQDPESTVVRASHAALKELTKQDFGPGEDPTPAETAKAVAAWKAWWQKNGKK